MGWVEGIAVVAAALVVLAAVWNAADRKHLAAKEDADVAAIGTTPDRGTLTHWMEDWYRSIRQQESASAAIRQSEAALSRKNYLRGYGDATAGRPNHYVTASVMVTGHESWCPALTATPEGKPRSCMCYFGARTNG